MGLGLLRALIDHCQWITRIFCREKGNGERSFVPTLICLTNCTAGVRWKMSPSDKGSWDQGKQSSLSSSNGFSLLRWKEVPQWTGPLLFFELIWLLGPFRCIMGLNRMEAHSEPFQRPLFRDWLYITLLHCITFVEKRSPDGNVFLGFQKAPRMGV